MPDDPVTKFVALFQGRGLTNVQSAVAEAMRQAYPETVTDPLSKLFDAQMETLLACDCPQSIIAVFRAMKPKVIAKAMEIGTTDGNIPFVPVISRTEVDLKGLMEMVRYRDQKGYSFFNRSNVIDVVDVPKGHHFMFDVENGRRMLGKTPKEAEHLINGQDRSPMILDEGIALCVHSNVLLEHFVDCTGSRGKHVENDVPFVYLSDGCPGRHCDGRPVLHWSCLVCARDGQGSASCRSRLLAS
jgi:hypothetical protein